ncbi:MAG TPA: ATP-binding protein [Nitrospirae bacterium]|nr:ATP-binding protein [Nitrospirota bacterium]
MNTKKKLDAFTCIAGQEHAKRALEVGAVGNSSILLVGPPGAGKTMLTSAYSKLVGNGIICLSIGDSIKDIKKREKNYRNALIIADDLTEFTRTVLLYIKEMAIRGLPVIASMYPCPCGYFGDKYHSCLCTNSQIQIYKVKISNIVEIFDIHVEVPSLMSRDIMAMLSGNCHSESIKDVKARVKQAQKTGYTNLEIDRSTASILETATQKLGFSMRTVNKTISIARSIANLADSERIGAEHISEAIQYRTMWSV